MGKKYIYIDIIANRSITGAVIITRDDESEGARRYLWQLVAIDKEILSGHSYKPVNDQQKTNKTKKNPQTIFKLWYSLHLRLLQMQLQIPTANLASLGLKKVHGGASKRQTSCGRLLRQLSSPREKSEGD